MYGPIVLPLLLLLMPLLPRNIGIYARPENEFPSCCSDVFGACKEACENFSLIDYATAHHQPVAPSASAIARYSNTRAGISPLADIKRQCPPSAHAFWQCLDPALAAVQRGHSWTGRSCCRLGISAHCRHACATASSAQDVERQQCRHSDEPTLFACLERRVEADRCCGRARTAGCMHHCQVVFAERGTVTVAQREGLEGACRNESITAEFGVMACVGGVVGEAVAQSFAQYAPCCNSSPHEHCQQTCRSALQRCNSTQDIIDTLVATGCGSVLPHDPLWKCFFRIGGSQPSQQQPQHNRQQPTSQRVTRPTSAVAAASTGTAVERTSRINQIGMDAAKQLCCQHAQSSKCRRLCLQTYTNDWTRAHARFETECLGATAATTTTTTTVPTEWAMRQCLEEVDEPCQLGCSGLDYCSHFNHRSTQLFRSCTPAADRAARADFAAWLATGLVNLTVAAPLPIRNVSACLPHDWHTIACVLQTRPCTRQRHTTRICRADCLNVLSRCLDVTRALPAGHSAESICARISVAPDESGGVQQCIALGDFVSDAVQPTAVAAASAMTAAVAIAAPTTMTTTTTTNVTFPCSAHTCDNDSLCELRDFDAAGFECSPACRLGETSNTRIAVGSYVRVPVVGAQTLANRLPGCHKVCRCQADGRLGQCQPLPCIEHDTCRKSTMGRERIEHAASVRVECNVCGCYAGEITCTRRQCRMPGGGGSEANSGESAETMLPVVNQHQQQITSLPCNCPAHFVPVCGANGQTYPSACVAACAGEEHVLFGACAEAEGDECAGVQCGGNRRCEPMRLVCLSVMQRPCRQYVCVNDSTDQSPLNAFSTQSCPPPSNDSATVVCGTNGRTYPDQCAALVDYSWPDYAGGCREFGRLGELVYSPQPANSQPPKSPPTACSASIECPQQTRRCLVGRRIPPGACCPVCAGAMRAVYARKQIDRALYGLPPADHHLVTLQQGVLAGVQRLLQVARCRVSGSLTVEGDVFVAVHAMEDDGGQLELVCGRELERVATLIDQQAAQIVADVALSALIGVRIVPALDVDGRGGDSGGDDRTYATAGERRRWQPPATVLLAVMSVWSVMCGEGLRQL